MKKLFAIHPDLYDAICTWMSTCVVSALDETALNRLHVGPHVYLKLEQVGLGGDMFESTLRMVIKKQALTTEIMHELAMAVFASKYGTIENTVDNAMAVTIRFCYGYTYDDQTFARIGECLLDTFAEINTFSAMLDESWQWHNREFLAKCRALT